MVGIRSGPVHNTTNLMLLSLTTISTTTEAHAVSVKRWTPLLFSCQISNNEWRSVQKGYVKQEQECFWPLFWSHHYRANGTVTSNEKAFSAGGANVRWNSTMMLNDPKNNINSAVFISIFFFREHLSASNKHICFLLLSLRWNKSWKAEERTYLFFTCRILLLWHCNRSCRSNHNSRQKPMILVTPWCWTFQK